MRTDRCGPTQAGLVHRRDFIRSALIAGAGVLTGRPAPAGSLPQEPEGSAVSSRAVDLVVRSQVVDMLGLVTMNWAKLLYWQEHPSRFALADYRLLESTGVSVFHPAVDTNDPDPRRGALRWLEGWNHLLGAQPCLLRRIDSAADLDEVRAARRLGVVLGFQNSTHFRDVSDVAAFHRLGQRVSQLTYNERNRLGSGCLSRPDRGLTPFGAAVVAEMNRLGMAVDVSHCGERTTLDAIAASTAPVLVTHANCRALVPGQVRNKTDLEIRRMAGSGGVMGITLVRGFVGRGSPTLEDVLDHFDHVARLVGVEHVGLGTDVARDVDAVAGAPRPAYRIRGLQPARRVFQLADGLIRRGYSDEDIVGILGGNFARALRLIWEAADLRPRPGNAPVSRRDPFCPPPLPPSRYDTLAGG